MNFFISSQIAALGITHGFFGRENDDGKPLDFSIANNNKTTLRQNQIKTLQQLNIHSSLSFILCKQEHGNSVRVITKKSDFSNDEYFSITADAIITNRADLAIGVITADCVPILLADKQKTCIAVIHAGWRGLLNGVIENTIEKFTKFSKFPIYATIGPCISNNNYQISAQVHNMFYNHNRAFDDFFAVDNSVKDNDTRYLADLRAVANKILKNYDAITAIDSVSLDTYSNPKLFFSHRYNKENNISCDGRQASIISLA